jgi:hypothetical protein
MPFTREFGSPCSVAMIVTKVPSEPLGMVQRTVDAMLSQDYPYPYGVPTASKMIKM